MSIKDLLAPSPGCGKALNGLHLAVGKDYLEEYYRDAWSARPKILFEGLGEEDKVCLICGKTVDAPSDSK